MLVFLAMIIMNVHAGNELAQRRKPFFDALLFEPVREMRVADIEIKPQTSKARFVVKSAQVSGITHFASGVFNANGHPDMPRVEHQVLQRTERRVAFAWIGGLTRAAHMKNHP